MGKQHVDVAEEIGAPLRAMAGGQAYSRFMEGSESIAEASDEDSPAAFAQWLKGAVDRLDATVDETTRVRFMEGHGAICAGMHQDHIDAMVEQYRHSGSLDAFVEANDMLSRDGDTVVQTYCPRSQGNGLRCYCSFWHALPPDQEVSMTWCHCGKGFTMKAWEAMLGQSVDVELLQSCMSGADSCKFAIHLPGDQAR